MGCTAIASIKSGQGAAVAPSPTPCPRSTAENAAVTPGVGNAAVGDAHDSVVSKLLGPSQPRLNAEEQRMSVCPIPTTLAGAT